MIGELIAKLVAKPIAASKTASKVVLIGLASVSESLLSALRLGFVKDISDVKNALKGSLLARTAQEEAEAQKRMAEATNEANKVTTRSQADEEARLKIARQALENQKLAAAVSEAEAKADKAKTEAARAKMRAYKEAVKLFEAGQKSAQSTKEKELFEALKQLKSEGGQLYIEKAQLEAILRLLPEKSGDDIE